MPKVCMCGTANPPPPSLLQGCIGLFCSPLTSLYVLNLLNRTLNSSPTTKLMYSFLRKITFKKGIELPNGLNSPHWLMFFSFVFFYTCIINL